MGIEAIKGAAMTYQGSTSTAETREEARSKVEQTENAGISNNIAKATVALDTKQTSGEGTGSNAQQQDQDKQKSEIADFDSQLSTAKAKASEYQKKIKEQNAQIKKAIEDINKKAMNSEAIFGIHEATNRVTIKIVDKDTKKVIKELPPEKTLDMIAKVWEMAGLMVDEKR